MKIPKIRLNSDIVSKTKILKSYIVDIDDFLNIILCNNLSNILDINYLHSSTIPELILQDDIVLRYDGKDIGILIDEVTSITPIDKFKHIDVNWIDWSSEEYIIFANKYKKEIVKKPTYVRLDSIQPYMSINCKSTRQPISFTPFKYLEKIDNSIFIRYKLSTIACTLKKVHNIMRGKNITDLYINSMPKFDIIGNSYKELLSTISKLKNID
jgi:hypothetical protein